MKEKVNPEEKILRIRGGGFTPALVKQYFMITNLKGMEKTHISPFYLVDYCLSVKLMCHLLVFGLIIHHLQTLFHPPSPPYVPFVDPPGGEACQERWPSLHVKRLTGELKRLTPALWTTHWPPLCGLPHGLLCWLPCRLSPRTSINNQPNFTIMGEETQAYLLNHVP